MNFLSRTLTIIIEIIVLVLSIVWYNQAKEIEPLIGIITSSGAFIASILAKFTIRPKIALHHTKNWSGQNIVHYTNNQPAIITIGIGHANIYWRLNWDYDLEIRNNSSQTAYNIDFNYINLPAKTYIEGEIGKIEPLQPHEQRTLSIKIVQYITGTSIDANRYRTQNENTLTAQFLIDVKYSDESGFKFKTCYNWNKDNNKFLLGWCS